MENMKYRYIYEYKFYRGTSAAGTARRIVDVYGAGIAKESTVRFWFQCFRSGNFDLQNQPRGRPEIKVENEDLKAIVEADLSQSTSEIAVGFGQLQTMKEELAAKQWRLVNRFRPLLLNDNATTHCTTNNHYVKGATIGMSATSTVLPGPCSNRLPFFPEFGQLFTRK
ncbi:hypothetical protein evm_012277 [Chilo suppressalis]|nr:hypothetical protein evm_012277 [Chilo suppressalis]